MSTRSTFSIFLDTPQPDQSLKAPNTPLLPSASNTNANHAHATAIIEKENLHPVTGERPGSTASANGKKRKTSSVLATKVHNPLTTKKQKESSSKTKPEAKKHKSSSSSSTSTSKPRSTSSDKESKRTGSGSRKKSSTTSRSSKSSSRKVSPLPKLDEEVEVAEMGQDRIRQAEVDSRCYELTVLPLADVTQAYDTSPSMDYPSSEPKLTIGRSVKEKSAEPELRDYYTPSLSSSSSMPSLSNSYSSSSSSSKRGMSTPPMESSQAAKTFSTPERKQIYTAFTFTSPSPTSVRIGLTRSTSVDSIHFQRST